MCSENLKANPKQQNTDSVPCDMLARKHTAHRRHSAFLLRVLILVAKKLFITTLIHNTSTVFLIT